MIRTAVLTGQQVGEVLDNLARLRIAVFRDWPYLYDGDADYERDYLRAYQSPGAVVVAAYDGARMVGAATGAPMEHHASDFAAVAPTILSSVLSSSTGASGFFIARICW